MDMSQYKGMFISEAREHLRVMGDDIVALEKEPGNREHIDSLFRKAHSIKGMAASMGYGAIAELAHKMEDFMDRIRGGAFSFQSSAADLLLEGADLIGTMVADVETDTPSTCEVGPLIARLLDYKPGAAEPTQPERPDTAAGTGPGETASRLKGEEGESRQTVRVKTELLDHLINITGELITTKHRLRDIETDLDSRRLSEAVGDLSRQLRQLHDEVIKVRMMPMALITDRFPRVVRDLAKKAGKEISFSVAGKEIELDRGILEELSDPLIHILRNAVDHGIEPPEEREAAGKETAGRVLLSARREKDHVVLTIEDDGRGMDPARLVAAAVARGIVKAEEGLSMSPRDAFMLTCIPGFSTARQVTDVSGRGVGMDAVKSAIKNLGGSLSIDSQKGSGTTITLKLPLTIAIIQILLVSCSHLTVGIPVSNIVRTIELARTRVTTRGKRKVFYLDDEMIPLLSLSKVLNLTPAPITKGLINAVITEIKGIKVGLVVDGFHGQQEVFVKPVGRPLKRLKGVNGGAILGDGKVVFLLDVPNLL